MSKVAATTKEAGVASEPVLVGGLQVRLEYFSGNVIYPHKVYARETLVEKLMRDAQQLTGKSGPKLFCNDQCLNPALKLEHVFLVSDCSEQGVLTLYAGFHEERVVLSIDMGIRNFAFWAGTIGADDVFDFDTKVWECVDMIAATGSDVESAKTAKIEECADVLEDYVDNYWPEMGDVRTILIEQQPVAGRFGNTPNNVRMNILSFLLRSLLRKKYPAADIVQFASPRLKMKIVDLQAVIPEGKTWDDLSKAQQYTCNKKAAIHTVQQHAKIPHRKGQKKDDYSDCLLQALAWTQVQRDLQAKQARTACRKKLATARKREKARRAAKPKKKKNSKKAKRKRESPES